MSGTDGSADDNQGTELARRLVDLGFAGLASAAVVSESQLAPALLPALDLLRGWKNREEFLQILRKHVSMEDLLERVTTDPRAANLWADTLRVASESDLLRKRQACARILHLGLFREDDAEIDPEPMYLQAIAPIETAHLRILDLLRHEQTMKDGGRIPLGEPWPSERIIEFFPQAAPLLDVLMNQLETWGFVIDDQPNSTRQPSNARWRVTTFGGSVYEFLRVSPDDTASP